MTPPCRQPAWDLHETNARPDPPDAATAVHQLHPPPPQHWRTLKLSLLSDVAAGGCAPNAWNAACLGPVVMGMCGDSLHW